MHSRREPQLVDDVEAPALVDHHDGQGSTSPSPPSKRRRPSLLAFKPSVLRPEDGSERTRRARQRSRVEAPEDGRRGGGSASGGSAGGGRGTPRRRARAVIPDDEDEAEDVEDGAEVERALRARVKPDPDAAAAADADEGPAVLVLPDSPARDAPSPRPSSSAAARAPPSPSSASPSRPVPPPPPPPRTSSSSSSSSSPSAPPPVPTFLLSLPLPSLARLTPLLHGLGLSTPSDLLQLANPAPAARRARDKVLARVDAMDRAERGERDGGVSAWERIVLEEELDDVWRRWGPGAAQA